MPSDELTFHFFKTFSRMEYALKAAGFRVGNSSRVDPNWDCFSEKIAPKFEENAINILAAIEYYTGYPPKKQVLVDEQLDWSDTLPDCRSRAELMINLIKRVRNNLFHGGKFEQSGNEERDEMLLRHGIELLEFCRDCSVPVQNAYYSGQEGAIILDCNPPV